MMDDLALRFRLGARLLKMRYGTSYAIDGDKAHMAWPPTGDHDRSIEGAIRAIALARGGHRPETSYTTAERITNDLDGSFDEPEFRPSVSGGQWIIHRKLSACPHCRGGGWVSVYPEPSPLALDESDLLIATATVQKARCEHLPR